MMDAVIRWLIQGIASQAKAEKKYVEEHPLQTPTDDDALRCAIRLLEAAKGCDRAVCLRLLNDDEDAIYGLHLDEIDRGWDQLHALVSALPEAK